MDMIPLTATARDLTVKPNVLRRANQVPCVVYGSVDKNLVIQCEEKSLHKAFVKAGESSLLELDVGSKKIPVLIKAITFDPVTDRETHVDFYAVNMKEEIEAPVRVHVTGESLAVKAEGGVLVMTHDTVHVRCLPADLPRELTIDISVLAAFGDAVTVKDIKLPKGVSITESPDTMVATVQEPRKEEEITPAPAVADSAAAVPGAEGAAAPGAAPAAGAAAPAADAKAPAGKDKK